MRYQRLRVLASGAGALTIAALSLFCSASATSTQHVVYSFTGGVDGGNAATSVAFAPSGKAIVTTVQGGADGCGTVDRLTPSQGAWTSRTLWTFTCGADGKNPHGGVTLDAAGDIFGTTVAGGSGGICVGDGCGVVYRIAARGGFRVIYNFTGGNDGFGPGNPVALDTHGNIYGDAPDGGAHGVGVVYQLSYRRGSWKQKVIHAFTGRDDGAVGSLGPLLVDSAGDIFGVTEIGGFHQAGNAFKITPNANGTWTFTVLYAFKGAPDAAFPYGGLISDASGDLYGTTYYGGTSGNGAVYELMPRSSGRYAERVLYSFSGGADGGNPTTTLMFDSAGDLVGTTTAGGGSCGCGVIFKLDHVTGLESVLHTFGSSRTDGQSPLYGLTADTNGDLFTATVGGGSFGQGAVFGMSTPMLRTAKDPFRAR